MLGGRLPTLLSKIQAPTSSHEDKSESIALYSKGELSMSNWYYRLGDAAEQGPMGPSELLELIRQGVIRENTYVRKGDSAMGHVDRS